jgi:CDP-2,3-bis-(O-geranylgeranyl)-sn-glycerol synthase
MIALADGAAARLDPFLCAAFVLLAFAPAGFVQTAWLKSRLSRPFHVPIDGGHSLGGKRILGANKTWGGFVVMVPAVGLLFAGLGLLCQVLPVGWDERLWPLSPLGYGLLGCWLGFAFMAGELPNSFLKRRLGVEPGTAPVHPVARPVCLLLDRLDSTAGATLALALVVPLPLWTAVCVLLVGPGLHWLFSLLLFRVGVKGRAS